MNGEELTPLVSVVQVLYIEPKTEAYISVLSLAEIFSFLNMF